jgi:serine/threonine protein kinase
MLIGDPKIEALGYRVVRAIAEGARAEVVLVESTSTGQKQAWKVLRPESAADPEALGRFMDEAYAYHQVRHPHVVRDLGAGRLPDGRLYLALELLEGVDLGACVRASGPLGPEDALRVFIPIGEALAHSHERGVIHRDVRPANIFLCGGLAAGRPKLMDFGRAYFQGTKSVETIAGTLLSQPAYSAPECIQGHRGDERSDLYAFGAAMYEALTGSPPFANGDSEPHPLPTASAHLQPIIDQCLAKKPNDRFTDARALLRKLGEFGVLPAAPAAPAAISGESRAEQVGDVFGKYELVRLLGDGGMARVWLARHATLGRQVALKILKPGQAQRRELVDRFFQEARAVNRIHHPNTVDIHDFVDETLPNGLRRSYCVMEALDGHTLRHELRNGPLELKKALGIIHQVCSALAAAHRVGVIHRDIKPENIFLLSKSDRVKVLDFGVAKLQGDAELLVKTLTGCIVGTPRYMAPEQVQGFPVDARTDIYSLGTVLYELLAGNEPFRAPSLVALGEMILSDLPPRLPETTPGGEPIPIALANIVVRCLEKKPPTRFPSMDSFASALEALAEETLPPPVDWEPPRKKSWRGKAVVASAGAILITGAAITALSSAATPKAHALAPVLPAASAPVAPPPSDIPPAPAPAPAPKPKPRPKAHHAPPEGEPAPRPGIDRDELIDPYAP